MQMNVLTDIQTEIEFFFKDLNWTYILIYAFIIHGIKYKEEFQWFNDFFSKDTLRPFKIWIAGIIVAIVFIIFKYLETGMQIEYVSILLRSWIIVIVFNSIFSRKMNTTEKKYFNDDKN